MDTTDITYYLDEAKKYDLLHYISLYDHNDKYFPTYNDLVSKIPLSLTLRSHFAATNKVFKSSG